LPRVRADTSRGSRQVNARAPADGNREPEVTRDTNRIVKKLVDDRLQTSRFDALLQERELPHGFPRDAAERMRSGGR